MAAVGAASRLGLLVLLGLALAPLQWLAARFYVPASRIIPLVFHRAACRLIGVRITAFGRPHPARPLLILSNHVSWLDIVVLSAVMPVVFVAKSEVVGWPVFGTLARLQRTVFVDRGRRQGSGTTAREMGQRLLGGDAVVLFAEGTSGDHNRVLPFRSSLIGAVRGDGLASARVQPVAIHYARLHGLPVGRRWRPGIAWYGDMELLPHLWALVRRGGIGVEVFFAEAVAADGDRKLLARDAETAIRAMIRSARIGTDPAGAILLHRETR